MEKDYIGDLAEDELQHSEALKEILNEIRRDNWSQLPPQFKISTEVLSLPGIDHKRANIENILEAVVELETSSLNAVHHKLLFHFGAEKNMNGLFDGHLGRVREGIIKFTHGEDLLDKINWYIDSLKRLEDSQE